MTLEPRQPDFPTEQAPAERKWMLRLLIPCTILAWGILTFLTFVLAGHVIETLILIAIAVLVAYALAPAVNRLEMRMPRWLAISVTYLLFAAALAAFIYLIVNTVTQEIMSLRGFILEVSSNKELQSLLQRLGISPASLATGTIFGGIANIAGAIVPILTGAANALVGIVVITVLSIYFVFAGPRIGRWLRTQTPLNHRERVNFFLDTVDRIVGGYIRGQVTLAALVGLLVGFGMGFLFHLPLAALLGLLAFVLEFIPFLGVIISGAACVLVALTQGYLVTLLVIGYFAFIHVIEGEVVGPRIVGRFVGLHPAVALIALIAGAELFGIWGALFAAPVAGLAQALIETLWTEYRREHPELFSGGPPLADASGEHPPEGGPGDRKKTRQTHSFQGIFFRPRR